MSTSVAFKHGVCEQKGCDQEAIFRVRTAKLCIVHKGPDTVFAPFLGQQEKMLCRRERVVFMGGAGGSGKSLILMMKFGQQLGLENSRFEKAKSRGIRFRSKAWGIYFRRTSPDFRQAVQRSYEYFQALDPAATYDEQKNQWKFPSCGDAVFQFAHMEHEKDRFKYKGPEYSYCTASGTRVLMGDGALRPIQEILPGELVQTLEGPKPVTAVWAPGKKPCVRAVVRDASGTLVGEQVHPVDHRVLSIYGARLPRSVEALPLDDQLPTKADEWPSHESVFRSRQGRRVVAAATGDGEICSEESDDGPRVFGRPGPLSVLVVLFAPARRLAGSGECGDDIGAHVESADLPGSRHDCRCECDFYDGRLRPWSDVVQSDPQPLGDAERYIHGDSRQDAADTTPSHIHRQLHGYSHPYTKEERQGSCGTYRIATCTMTPCEETEVFDLTVEGANHYITETGLVNRNCAFDELTEFTEVQYDYMDTRLRTTDAELEPYLQICSASNPDGEGLIWVRERFVEIAPPETVVQIETKLRDGRIKVYEQVFIPGKLDDNPLLMASGSYEASLLNKRPEVREAILMGNWYIAPGAFLGATWDSNMHVVEDHDIPPGARVFRAADWGINNPSSIGWWYEDADGGLTCFAHLRTVGLTVDKVVEKMRAIEDKYGLWDEDARESGLNFARNPLDSSCFGEGQGLIGARTIAKDFSSLGFRWKRAPKGPGSRLQGASQILKRLCTYIPAAFDGADHPTERLRPMLRFMRSCKSPINTLPVLKSDPNNIDDVDTDGDDHDWDMTMYACLENPVAMPEETDEDDDEDETAFAPQRVRSRGGLGDGPWTR